MLVTEEALQVSDVQSPREKTSCNRVSQQVRVYALHDAGGGGDAADHLADALASHDMGH